MKKAYMKPSVEVEVYTLSASIASNCINIVTLGPEDPMLSKPACAEFEDLWKINTQIGGGAGIMSISFYDAGGTAGCDCYYTAGGDGYFTS